MHREEEVVGRAELKLAEAVRAFGYDFREKIVLDIGSSTGGFTEYALRRGARQVIAIEKGTRQMKAPLRDDPRIVLREKTDFLDLKERFNVNTVLADVSFVSLRVILKKAKRIVRRDADYLVMLKPQFEAKPNQLVRGVVKNEKIRREIIRQFEDWLRREGFVVLKKRDNELVGKNGNRERFYFLRVAKRPDLS